MNATHHTDVERTDATITGPHVGHDKYGRPEYTYWVCGRCGAQSVHRADLEAHTCGEI